MFVNVIAFKANVEKNLIVRTKAPLNLANLKHTTQNTEGIVIEDSVTVTDDSTKATLQFSPYDVLYISTIDEDEVIGKETDKIKPKKKKSAFKAEIVSEEG